VGLAGILSASLAPASRALDSKRVVEEICADLSLNLFARATALKIFAAVASRLSAGTGDKRVDRSRSPGNLCGCFAGILLSMRISRPARLSLLFLCLPHTLFAWISVPSTRSRQRMHAHAEYRILIFLLTSGRSACFQVVVGAPRTPFAILLTRAARRAPRLGSPGNLCGCLLRGSPVCALNPFHVTCASPVGRQEAQGFR